VVDNRFGGFSGNAGFSPFPNEFFGDLLSKIDHLAELKVTLYALWLVANMEGAAHPLFVEDFAEGVPAEQLAEGLEKCVRRGSLLRVTREAEGDVYFINSPRGRASAEAARDGHWIPSKKQIAPPLARPNIFKLLIKISLRLSGCRVGWSGRYDRDCGASEEHDREGQIGDIQVQ